MLIVKPVGPQVVPYFSDGRHPGRWAEGAERLLGLSGPVDRGELQRVLEGRHPADGRFLPDHRPRRRRGGWDLIFAAPKSVSLLAAGPEGRVSVAAAHADAVSGVMEMVGARLLLRRTSGGVRCAADALVAAGFEHRTNAAGEPHLHSHVLVANLSRGPEGWGAIDSFDWTVGRPAMAAMYQLELRHQMARYGWDLEWRLRADGLSDLADVSRAAIRAASSQGRLARSAGRFEARRRADEGRARTGGDRSRAGEARTVSVAVRRGAGDARPMSGPDRPRASGDRALDDPGLGDRTRQGRAGGDPALDDPALERAVALRLSVRRSDFKAADVLVALAACHPAGTSAADAQLWAERFCARSVSVPSPTAGRRWTTAAAMRADDELAHRLGRYGSIGGGPAVAASETEAALGARPWLDRSAREVVRALTARADGVVLLGTPPGTCGLLGQAEVLDACRSAWEAAGARVAVDSPTAEAQRRWSVLSGLAPYRPGDRPDVLVVDRADRRTTSELGRLAAVSRAKLLLVEGGTLPRLTNPASHGLVRLGAELGRWSCPAPAAWVPGPTHPGAGIGPAVGRPGAEQVLGQWRVAGATPLLVGLGLEEVRALNRAAQRWLRGANGDGGLLPGDRVVVLGRRPGLPGYGTFGTVTATTARRPVGRRSVTVTWADGTDSIVAPADAPVLGLGYAVTPRVAARTAGPLMVLGPASALGRARGRVLADTGWTPPGRTPEVGRTAGWTGG